MKHKTFNINVGNSFAIFMQSVLLTLRENLKNEKCGKGRSVWVSQSFLEVPYSLVLKAACLAL